MELIAPAGNLAKLKTAFAFGADAVYCGIPDFSLRVRINEFDLNSLREGIRYAHSLNKRVYVTANIFAHNRHLAEFEKYVKELSVLKPDALVISDSGILSIVREIWPDVNIHLSTQANCTNWRAAKFWADQGVRRIILAREVGLAEIKEIHEKVPSVELEYFVHGAMCMAYSGRCLLSKYFTGRSANLGDCIQPCRWEYKIQTVPKGSRWDKMQNKFKNQTIKFKNKNLDEVILGEIGHPDKLLLAEEDGHGAYIMNSKDLCLVEYLPELIEAGITAFKIEGRAKSVYYVGNTVNVYREAFNDLAEGNHFDKNKYLAELRKCENRGFTSGFLFGEEKCEQNINQSHEKCGWEFCGVMTDNGLRVHNQIYVGDEIEFIVPAGKNFVYKVEKMFDSEMKEIAEAHGGQGEIVFLPTGKELPEFTLARRRLTG